MTTKPPQAERVEAWRTQMPESDRRTFEAVAGDLLAELGYRTEAGAATAGANPGLPS
jgi:hypothetical protein